MRIAFIVGRFPSLSETFILNQITGLLDRGYEVDIYARRPDEGDKVHPDVEKYRLGERVLYRAMPRNAVWRGVKAMGILARHPALRRALNGGRHGREGKSLKLFYWAAAFLKRGADYDIVHAHFGPNGLLAVALREVGAIGPRTRMITSFYGYDVHRYPLNHGKEVYRRLFERGDLILCLSQTMRRELLAMGAPEDKTVVHHIGTDAGRFQFRARRAAEDGVVRLVSIARLVEKKGLTYAIDAVAKVVAAGQRVSYEIVGDGELRENLKSQISNLKLEGIVHLLGWKTQQEVVEILDRAHILLAPSVTAASGDQEGTPVALMEAMAMGLPVISTFHSGIPEMIHDGECGYLVAERDAVALAEKILEMSRQSEQWVQMGAEGRKVIEQEFNAGHLNDVLVKRYDQILA